MKETLYMLLNVLEVAKLWVKYWFLIAPYLGIMLLVLMNINVKSTCLNFLLTWPPCKTIGLFISWQNTSPKWRNNFSLDLSPRVKKIWGQLIDNQLTKSKLHNIQMKKWQFLSPISRLNQATEAHFLWCVTVSVDFQIIVYAFLDNSVYFINWRRKNKIQFEGSSWSVMKFIEVVFQILLAWGHVVKYQFL